jgi:RNA polymerase sigma factor (sigma-70 family)
VAPNLPRNWNPLVSQFTTTNWQWIEEASSVDPAVSRRAIDALSRQYYKPLFCYLRQLGQSPADADDLILHFFELRFINQRVFRGVTPANGRFRTWLKACLKNLVRNEIKSRRRSEQRFRSTGMVDAEARYQLEPDRTLSAEAMFDRVWASELVDDTLRALEAEYRRKGKGELYDALQSLLRPRSRATYKQVAERLSKQENQVRAAMSEFNAAWRERIFDAVRATVKSDVEADAERRYLLNLLIMSK